MKKLFKSKFFKNSSYLFLGTLTSQLIMASSSLFISRIYSPATFGNFAICISIISILGNIANLKFDQALIIAKENSEKNALVKISIISSILMITFLLILIPIFSSFFSQLQWFNILKENIVYISTWIFLFSTIFTLRYYHLSKDNFFITSISSPTRSSVILIFQFALGKLSPSLESLLSSQIVGEFTNFLILNPFNKIKEIFGAKDLKKVFKKYIEFPKFAMPNMLLHSLTFNLDNILLISYFSNKHVGYYAMANKILNAPINLIVGSIKDAFYKKISDYSSDKKRIRKNYLQLSLILMVISIVPMTITFYWGYEIFGFLLGKEWSTAGEIAAYLTFYLFTYLAISPIFSILKVINQQKIQLYYQIFQAILRPTLLITLATNYTIIETIKWLSIGSSIPAIFLSIWTFKLLSKQ